MVKSSTQATYGDVREEDCPVSERYNAGARFATPQMQAGTFRGETCSGEQLFARLMDEYDKLAAPLPAIMSGTRKEARGRGTGDKCGTCSRADSDNSEKASPERMDATTLSNFDLRLELSIITKSRAFTRRAAFMAGQS